MTLSSKLNNILELRLAGFSYLPPQYGRLAHRFFTDVPVQEQFDAFADRVVAALGKSYLPICRMADGEFSFLVGWRAPLPSEGQSPLWHSVRWRLRHILDNFRGQGFTTCWGEYYSRTESQMARQRMEESLRQVAAKGLLALYFARRPDRWGEQYFESICEWFDCHGITLSEDNCVPFYFVYALLNGPYRRNLYCGNHILIVTHLSDQRKAAMAASLRAENVASVQFLGISPNKSMFDQLDLSLVRSPVDVALVAAGIGSANILVQLEPLSIPCIDCGITLECFVDPSLRHRRAFLLDDERARGSSC